MLLLPWSNWYCQSQSSCDMDMASNCFVICWRMANYLDDHEPAVAEFARKVFPRLDEGIYVWLLDEYWKKLEEVSGDPSMGVFSRRGMWFCRAMLVDVGVKVIYPR